MKNLTKKFQTIAFMGIGLSMLFIYSCKKDDPIPPPVAGFTFDIVRDVVTFTNTSTESETYSWDFGDGSSASTEVSPTHTYAALGNYTVKLTATNSEKVTDIKSLSFAISDVPTAPVADFTFEVVDKTVTFTNTTSDGDPADSYAWDFGDGNSSTDKDPVHIYTDYGVYTAKLTATNTTGVTLKLEVITVAVDAEAIFTYKTSGKRLTITNMSLNADSYAWDFGDGTTSTDQDPAAHMYAATGKYTIKLVATNAFGEDTQEMELSYYAIDGDFSDWADIAAYDVTYNGTVIAIKAISDNDSVYFYYESTNTLDANYTPYWRVDTDDDKSTGWIGWWENGTDDGFDIDFGTCCDSQYWINKWDAETSGFEGWFKNDVNPEVSRRFADSKYEGAISREHVGITGSKITFLLVDRDNTWSNSGYGPAKDQASLELDLVANE